MMKRASLVAVFSPMPGSAERLWMRDFIGWGQYTTASG
jgi:hypothetical protein